MSRAAIVLPVLLGIIVVLWGCSPYQSTPSTVPDKALEARVDKLEKELKTAKDQMAVAAADLKVEQGKRATAEKERATAEKERDGLKLQVKHRVDELTKAQTDLDGLRKGLKELLGKADAALAPLDPSGTNLSAK